MYQTGQLDLESSVKTEADQERLLEEEKRRQEEQLKAELKSLTDSGAVVERLPSLTGKAWEYAVECLLSLGDLAAAREAVLNGRHEVSAKHWAEACVLVADQALQVQDDTNESLDQGLAKELLSLLVEKEKPCEALEVFTQLAVSDAQRAANLLSREREQRSKADPEVLEELKAGAEELFEQVMARVRESVLLAEEWGVAKAHMSQIGPKEALGAWTNKPRIRERWNTLLRLVAKRRRMPDVFEVCDARKACWVHADHSTTEFIARAAVATVHLTGLVDSFHTMPPAVFPEVVFVGWSNVGKSSLINSLLHRTAVAPVSKMPGKTTQFHFYTINEKNAAFPQMTLVDVPGLGAAMADEKQTRHWQSTLDLYLKKRGNMLRQVFHLISCEVLLHNKQPSALDMAVMEMCLRHRRQYGVDYRVVITKVDLIKKAADVQAVYETLRNICKRLKLGMVQIVPCSVRKIRGRIALWKCLWRSVDPGLSEQPRPTDLKDIQKDLDMLVEQGNVTALLERVEQELDGDVWDYAIRCLARLDLQRAWQLVLQGPSIQGVEVLPTQDLNEDEVIGTLKDDLMEEADLEEVETEETSEPSLEELEVSEAADLFQEDGEVKELLSAAQERAALVVGEAAFNSEPGSESWVLAEEILEKLAESPSARGELWMEKAVCLSRFEKAPFNKMFAELGHLLSLVQQDATMTPWTVDRWNRLILSVGRERRLCHVDRVLDYMQKFQVKGDKETDAAVAQLAVTSLEVLQQAPSLAGLQPQVDQPEVLLLGSNGLRTPSERTSLASSVVSMQPRRRLEDDLAFEGAEKGRKGKRGTRKKRSPSKVLETSASLLRINCAEGAVPVQILDVPVGRRPSVTIVEKELSKSQQSSAAVGGVWGSSTEAESSKTLHSIWRDEVCAHLEAPGLRLAGVFQMVDARDFAKDIAELVPTDAHPGDERFIHQRLTEMIATVGNSLAPDDALIQAKIFSANPAHYVLVVADSSQLTLTTGRFLHNFYVSPFVAQQRREFLREKLLHDAKIAARITGTGDGPKISVIMADSEQFYHDWEFWRRLWECTE